MPNKNEIQKIHYYLNLVVKKRWFVIVSFCLAMIAGIYVALISPPRYQANTMILVEPQRVPSDYVKSLVTIDINSRIGTISQQIMSRSNLEKIIKQFNLFSAPEEQKMFIEMKLKNLQKRISVQVTRSGRESNSFSISFRGKDPEKAMNIANTLASYFIDANLIIREQQATGTSDFLEDELGAMRRRLEEVEETLKNFKKKYMGELPEQLTTNLAIFGRLQEQLPEKEKNLRATKQMLASLTQSKIDSQPIQNFELISNDDSPFAADTTDSEKLNELKEKLADLKTRYTDKHPDVVTTSKAIDELEAKINEESMSTDEDASLEPETQIEPVEIEGQDIFSIQKAELERDISAQEIEIAHIRKQIGVYEARVENTPKREQELMALQRDHKNIQNSYNSLLSRKLEAEIAVNMEKKKKAEQFRIVDHAKMPEEPISPNLIMLLLVSLAGGFGIGIGLIIALDFLNDSIRKPTDTDKLGIPVLATVPRIIHPRDRIIKRVNLAMTGLFLSIDFLLFACFALLTRKGVGPAIEFVQKFVDIEEIINRIS
jgi:polysaccharide chain length determinant protein (PEP-CTERM system associated)